MFYVYILKSMKDQSLYVGHTENLSKRLNSHNSGKNKYSKTKKPYRLSWFCCFKDKTKAIKFEKYLKVGSGRAFAIKRLL